MSKVVVVFGRYEALDGIATGALSEKNLKEAIFIETLAAKSYLLNVEVEEIFHCEQSYQIARAKDLRPISREQITLSTIQLYITSFRQCVKEGKVIWSSDYRARSFEDEINQVLTKAGLHPIRFRPFKNDWEYVKVEFRRALQESNGNDVLFY